MSVAGTYDCVTKSPMGDQQGTFTVVPGADGSSFTGTMSGPMGSMDVENGAIDGNRLSWTMNMTSPMPMTLEGQCTIDGDVLDGGIKAGAFGTMPITGQRQG